MPSSSRISVSVSAQISSSRCQSVELRASRETSSPSTMPARPSPTSATSFWKPSRSVARGARQAEVGVDDDHAIKRPAQRHGALAQGVLALGALGVLEDLAHGRLAHVEVGIAPQVAGGDLLVSFATHSVSLLLRGQGHAGQHPHDGGVDLLAGEQRCSCVPRREPGKCTPSAAHIHAATPWRSSTTSPAGLPVLAPASTWLRNAS